VDGGGVRQAKPRYAVAFASLLKISGTVVSPIPLYFLLA
jgi:hypothetical protein